MGFVVGGLAAIWCAAAPAPAAGAAEPDEIIVEVELDGGRTTARVTVTQQTLTARLREHLSKSFGLPDARLTGNELLIWRNLRLEGMSVTPRQDSVDVRFTPEGHVALSVTADVAGHPKYEYDHWVRLRRQTRTTTGNLSTTLSGRAAFAPTIERRGDRIVLLLTPVADGGHLDVGEVKVTGINGTLNKLTAKVRRHLAEKAARDAFRDQVLVAREIDLTKSLNGKLGNAPIQGVGVKVTDGKAVFEVVTGAAAQ